MNSWDRSDSDLEHNVVGVNDLDLARRLFKAGTEHRKYLRQIFVTMDITAPMYWWSEMDTYKIGTTSNSCSKMHKLMAKPFTMNDFSFDYTKVFQNGVLEDIIDDLNELREGYVNYDKYVESGEMNPKISKKDIWYALLQILPESYNQRRTITMNYENVFSIIHQRTGHKLDEWNKFVKILRELPYVKQIGGLAEDYYDRGKDLVHAIN